MSHATTPPTFFIVDPERLLQLLLHSLLVLLDQKLCAQLAELLELQEAGVVLVDLED